MQNVLDLRWIKVRILFSFKRLSQNAHCWKSRPRGGRTYCCPKPCVVTGPRQPSPEHPVSESPVIHIHCGLSRKHSPSNTQTSPALLQLIWAQFEHQITLKVHCYFALIIIYCFLNRPVILASGYK